MYLGAFFACMCACAGLDLYFVIGIGKKYTA